jgi:predicted permease
MKSTPDISLAGPRFSFRDLLLALQITLCSVLVTASFVSLRGLNKTLSSDLGFNPQNVTIAGFDLQLAAYKSADAERFNRQVLERASHLPGVTAAGFANTIPLSLDQSGYAIYAEDTTDMRNANMKFGAQVYSVSPGYFRAAGTRLLAGRDFTWHDDEHAPKVAVVNQTFVRKLFGTEQAIGKRFKEHDGHTYEIVGIVEEGKYQTVAEDSTAAVFDPSGQYPDTATRLLVRSTTSSTETASALHKLITSLDPGVPISNIVSWQDDLAIALFPARAATIALGILGGLALMLAITGIFGLASYSVSKRLREFGIRIALGASSREVLRTALTRTLVLLTIGSFAGLALGAAASRLLASIVYGANSRDPLVLIGAVITMVLVGLISAAIPAKRALSVDPVVLLRTE